jgi:hypothetical protein
MSGAISFLRVVLSLSLCTSVVFLYCAVWTTDACYTVPCLSSDYSVNVMRVSVSTSVSAVVYGSSMVLSPFVGLYLLYTRCRSFVGGVYIGSMTIICLCSWLQTITWAEEYSDLLNMRKEEVLMFGNQYTLNTHLRDNTEIMTILSGLSSTFNSIACLALFRWRQEVCVDHYLNGSRTNTVRHYHAVATSDTIDTTTT